MSTIIIRFDNTPLGPVTLTYSREFTMVEEREEAFIKRVIAIIPEQTEALAQKLYPYDDFQDIHGRGGEQTEPTHS